MTLERFCVREVCGKLFTVISKADKKKYCSRSCSSIVNNSLSPKRSPEGLCDVCSCTIPRSRKYCDDHIRRGKFFYIIAGQRYPYEEAIALWKSGVWVGGSERSVSIAVRKYILHKFDHSCSVCGFNEKHPDDGADIVEVDHINGVGSDHREDNLTVLCPNHHAMTSTYRGRNRGSGRKVFYTRVLRADVVASEDV